MQKQLWIAATVVGLVMGSVACGDDEGTEGPGGNGGDGGDGGSAAGGGVGGEGATGGDGGDGGIGDPCMDACTCSNGTQGTPTCNDEDVVTHCECVVEDDKPDYDALAMCGSDGGCEAVVMERIEGGESYALSGDATCLLEALADGTEGRYMLESYDNHGGGYESIQHVLVVNADGSVSRAAHIEVDVQTSTPPEFLESYEAAMRCDVAGGSVIDDCLDAVDAGAEEAASCLFGAAIDDLFEGCASEANVCE